MREEFARWVREDAKDIDVIINLIAVHGFDLLEFLETQEPKTNKWGFIVENMTNE